MQTSLLQKESKCATLENKPLQVIVPRDDLEREHRNLMERLHQLRRLLGYPPLPTGKQIREIRNDSR